MVYLVSYRMEAMTKRKMSYEQSLALEKANETRRANQRARRRMIEETPPQTPEQRAKWEAERKEALRRYRAKKNKA